MKSPLIRVGTDTRTSDYITGHAAATEGRNYGKDPLATAFKLMSLLDLGVTIPKWKPTNKRE